MKLVMKQSVYLINIGKMPAIGEVIEVENKQGKDLVKAGLAVEFVEEKPKKVEKPKAEDKSDDKPKTKRKAKASDK
jgi:hypothetical protein